MDIVIPLGKGSQNGNLELRYCLRGIEKHVGGRGNVFIIGECPGFLHNVIHIPASDTREKHFKARNICTKLLLACDDKRVSDDFAWFSDDHILLKEYQPDYNYRATLEASLRNFTIHQTYRHTITNTYMVMQGGYDYGHGPMVFKKDLFARAMGLVNWNERWGYVIKSLYCGLNGIEGQKQPDTKFKEPISAQQILSRIKGRPYFSFDDRAMNGALKTVLDQMFPQKSIYER